MKAAKAFMCVFMLCKEKRVVSMRALPWAGENNKGCYCLGFGKGAASSFTAYQHITTSVFSLPTSLGCFCNGSLCPNISQKLYPQILRLSTTLAERALGVK